MTECNSHETHNIYPNLNAIPVNEQQQFRLNKINEIKGYFVTERGKVCSALLSLAEKVIC